MVSTETFAVDVLASLAIIATAGIIGELIISYIRRAGHRAGARVVTVSLVRQLVRITWIGLALIGVLTVWGVTSDLLAAVVVAVVALVISLSLQSTISNMISGVFLLTDGAIRVGDHIEHFAIKGVVVRVALRNTWVRTETGEIAVVGNTKLADGPTLNLDLGARFDAPASPLPWRGRKSPPPSSSPSTPDAELPGRGNS